MGCCHCVLPMIVVYANTTQSYMGDMLNAGMFATSRNWINHIKDGVFVRNLLILIFAIFIVIGITVLYLKGDFDVERYKATLDISIGTIFGTGVLKLLTRKS